MTFLDKLLGRNLTLEKPAPAMTDEQSVERYEYLLRTAKPETIEQAHVDAFEKLTPEQRDLVFERFLAESPVGERPTDASPATLAKTATRGEAREPGVLTRTLSGDRSAGGDGGTSRPVDGSLLGTFAAYAIASSAIDAIFWAGLIGTSVAVDGAAQNDAPDSADTAEDSGAGADFFGGFDF